VDASSEARTRLTLLFVSRDSRNPLSNYQRVDMIRPLISFNGFQIAHVPHHREFVHNAVSAQQIPAQPRTLQRDLDVVLLQHRNVRQVRPNRYQSAPASGSLAVHADRWRTAAASRIPDAAIEERQARSHRCRQTWLLRLGARLGAVFHRSGNS
jgi:hypothetical protein